MIYDLTASTLREMVAVFLMDAVADGQGGTTESIPSGLVPDRAAAVEPATGRAAYVANQLADRLQYYVYLRWDVGITTLHRLLWRAAYWDIVEVQNLDMVDTWLRLTIQRREEGTQ